MNNSRNKRRHNKTGSIQIQSKSSDLDSLANIDKKKSDLIDRLNMTIDLIGNTKNIGLFPQDPVIANLQKIQQQAKMYDFKQIGKMANLAIGKRILNLQLERRRTEIQNKIQKKRQIEDYFRQNRVNKTNYQQIALQKLKQNILIVKPYSNGKGFVESTAFYDKYISSMTGESYEHYFQQCDFLKVIKHVNKMFFNNFSSSSSLQSRKQAANHPFIKISLIILFIIACFCVALSYTTSDIIGYIIFSLNLIMLIGLSIIVFHSYFTVKVNNNQLEETIMNIKQYFRQINQKILLMGVKHEWVCPNHFLYLEIKLYQNKENQKNIK